MPESPGAVRSRSVGLEWIVLGVGLVLAIGLLALPQLWSADVRFAVRLVHIITGVGWLGEVFAVNFVLLPAVARAEPGKGGPMLAAIFPRVFRLATALGGLAIISGAVAFVITTDWQVAAALGSSWGQRIALGGILGGALFVFHLIQESAWEGSLASRIVASVDDPARSQALLRRLRILPAVGMVILLVSITLMSAAARLA